jgi:hypothetical protein
MMSKKMTIVLNNIHCNSKSESGHDEVYIKYSLDGGTFYRFPKKGYQPMAPGDDWDPELPLTFSSSAVVSLYDSDFGKDDFLGSHTYYPDDPQPETVTVSNPNGANYSLSTILKSA